MTGTVKASVRLLACVPIAALYIALGGMAQAKSLSVTPPRYTWSGVRPGAVSEMPRTVRITNLSEQPRAYKLSAKSCTEAGVTPSGGCEDLPDASWVAFDRRYVTIKAGGQAQVAAYLSVPADLRYCGRNWQYYIEVREDVPQYGYIQGQPDLFALAVFLKVSVSTVDLAASAEPNSVAQAHLRTAGNTSSSTYASFPAIPLICGWLYCPAVTDIDRLIGGLASLIIAPGNIEVPGKTEQL
jgi:hypothetical protein